MYTYKAIIVSVYDGDTVTADVDLGFEVWLKGQTLRLLNIDTPEVRGKEKAEGIVSRDALRARILGKEVKVAVFADGDHASDAQAAGAEYVGMDDLAEKFQKDEVNVDVVLSTNSAMKVVGKLGQVLGPKGLMPNPKLGTVTPNVGDAVKAAKSGEVQFRAEKAGIIHAGIGKASFSEAKLAQNVNAFIDAITKAKPSGVKGSYIKKVSISSTMGPGLKLNMSGDPGNA